MNVSKDSLLQLHDADAAGARVREVVQSASSSTLRLTHFLARYASWNGVFGAGVASLSAKIARSLNLFAESGYPGPIADRSVLVASYFFDAARAEFDDGGTRHRDTHRCLAQACLAGLVEIARPDHPELAEDRLATTLMSPSWLNALRDGVATGYGHGSADDYANIYKAMGYHLGSELLADREFSVIDEAMRTLGDLVPQLEAKEVMIAGQAHSCYIWIGAHSGHGGAAEADHFRWAVRGVDRSFDFVPESLHEPLRRQIDAGYKAFAADHDAFFEKVMDV